MLEAILVPIGWAVAAAGVAGARRARRRFRGEV